MKLKSTGATEWLQQSLNDNPRLPTLTRHVMTAMSSGDDAAAAWRILGTDDDTVAGVVWRVEAALKAAMDEANRPTATNERDGIDRVIMLARQLQNEIRSVMPGDKATVVLDDVPAGRNKPAFVEFGWHSMRPGGYIGGYPVCVDDVLDFAIKLAKQHAENLPVRAVSRRGDRPEVKAFVRHLAWQFNREFGKEMRGTIAYITCAIFDLENPLDAAAVEGILKDRPAPFKAPT